MKTLYLHIGTPKTGTSAIQRFLWDNTEYLAAHSFCYPRFSYVYPRSRTTNGLFLTSKIVDDQGNRLYEEEKQRYKEGMQIVAKCFEAYDNVILSDENIWINTYEDKTDFWTKLLQTAEAGNYKVKIIVYLRRQDAYLDSWWNQKIKHTGATDVYDLSRWDRRKGKYIATNYYEALEKISAVMGAENITVRRYDRDYFEGGSIVPDFMNFLGLEMSDMAESEKKEVNPRLSGNTTEIKRVLNSIPALSVKENRYFQNVLLSYSKVSEEIYPNVMGDSKAAKAVLAKYKEGNRLVAEEYIKDGDDMFNEEFKDLPKWEKDNSYMMDDIIRFIGSSDIKLLRMIEEQKMQIKLQQELLKELKKKNMELDKSLKRLDKEMGKQKDALEDFKWKLKHPIRTLFKKIFPNK